MIKATMASILDGNVDINNVQMMRRPRNSHKEDRLEKMQELPA